MFPLLSSLRLRVDFLFGRVRPFAAAAAVASAAACTALAALATPLAARAQAPVPPVLGTRPDPLDAQARVPPLLHQSAFAQYRRLGEVPVGSWREANDTVTRIGGWRAYAREAAEPALPAASLPAVSVPAGSASAPGMKPAEPAEPAKAAPKPGGKDPHGAHKMN